MRDAVSNRGIDGELRDVAAHAHIVAAGFFSGQRPALAFHFVRRLPGARDHFTDTAHCLRIRRHHADRAQIVKDIFGGNRLCTYARFRKGHVFRNRGAQVMAHHEHVEVLVQRVDRERHRGIRGGRQTIRLAANLDDVRRVTAARAFGVVSVNRASLERANRILDVAGFVDRVGMNRDLHVKLFRHGESAIDCRGSSAPVFVQLQTNCAGLDLLAQRLRRGRISFTQKSQINGKAVGRFQHAMHVPRAWRARGSVSAGGRASAAANQRRQAARKRGLDKLRANKMDVGVNSAGCHDFSFTGDYFRSRADDHSGRYTAHDVRVASLANSHNASAADSDVGLIDSAVVYDHRIRDDQIENAIRGSRRRRLSHAVADYFAAAKFCFFAGRRKVLFNFDEQFRIGQANAVTSGRSVQVRILPPRNFQTHSFVRRILVGARHAVPLQISMALPALVCRAGEKARLKTLLGGAFQRA